MYVTMISQETIAQTRANSAFDLVVVGPGYRVLSLERPDSSLTSSFLGRLGKGGPGRSGDIVAPQAVSPLRGACEVVSDLVLELENSQTTVFLRPDVPFESPMPSQESKSRKCRMLFWSCLGVESVELIVRSGKFGV